MPTSSEYCNGPSALETVGFRQVEDFGGFLAFDVQPIVGNLALMDFHGGGGAGGRGYFSSERGGHALWHKTAHLATEPGDFLDDALNSGTCIPPWA